MTAHAAFAVIGAGYGDEGKGLMVDALAAGLHEPVVVRSNGGAQAGHTVTLADGRRHVFHHIGAGAMAGAATHLSRFFVHHPMLLERERAAVAALGGMTAITADPRGLVTTPWDMLVNQAAERTRGTGRHGSCGLGFGETIERSLRAPFRLTVADLDASDLRARLQAVRSAWTPARLTTLGVDLTTEEAGVLADDAILEVFLRDCQALLDVVALKPDRELAGPVIFEGAQGLLLDQAIGTMPHVTRSHTGLTNIAAIAREASLDAVEAVYVTRAYATRHGAGPLRGAGALETFEVDDQTNAPNAWQGRMRYAPLDVEQLRSAIKADLRLADLGPLRLTRRLAVTCLDQARGAVPTFDGDRCRRTAAVGLATRLAGQLGLSLLAEGWGPARTGVRLHQTRFAAA